MGQTKFSFVDGERIGLILSAFTKPVSCQFSITVCLGGNVQAVK
jgi:hypothetical protein